MCKVEQYKNQEQQTTIMGKKETEVKCARGEKRKKE